MEDEFSSSEDEESYSDGEPLVVEENEELEVPDQHYVKGVDQEDEELEVEEEEAEEQELNSKDDKKIEMEIKEDKKLEVEIKEDE